MARLVFAKAFRRHVECPDADVEGPTVGEVLTRYFEMHPQVRGYVLDERGGVRRHVTVFVDERQLAHGEALEGSVSDGDTVYLFQALSGG